MRPIRILYIILAAIIIMPLAAAAPATATALPDYDTGQLVRLGALGGGQSYAGAMNDQGDIVGASTDAEQNFQAAAWWHGQTSATALGVKGFAVAVSSNGHVVGTVDGDASRLFLWRRGTLAYLRLAAGSGLTRS